MGGIIHVSPGLYDRHHGMDTTQQACAATGDSTATAAGKKNPEKSDKQWCVEWPWADIWKRLFWRGDSRSVERGDGRVLQEFRIWTGAHTRVRLQGPIPTTTTQLAALRKAHWLKGSDTEAIKKKDNFLRFFAELASLTLRSWIYRQRDVPNGSVICSAWLF